MQLQRLSQEGANTKDTLVWILTDLPTLEDKREYAFEDSQLVFRYTAVP